MNAPLRILAVVAAAAMLEACAAGYYWQAATGHLALMQKRRPVADVLADAGTPATLRARLAEASAAREFAVSELGLPDNGSYRQFAALERPYVVWNVVATPEFSLEPLRHCFPVAGCVSYRGYFSEDAARRFAAKQAGRGMDVLVGGVTAYSTLGRFDDPIVDTMLRLPGPLAAGVIFHELAHQKLYLPGDTAFNESFASFVEQEGLRRWLAAGGDAAASDWYQRWLERRAGVRALLAATRARLEALYASGGTPAEMRAGKAAAFEQLAADYGALRDGWEEPPWFDGWFAPPLNNARLAALGEYDRYVPAFAALLAETRGDLEAFYAAAAALAELPEATRRARLAALP